MPKNIMKKATTQIAAHYILCSLDLIVQVSLAIRGGYVPENFEPRIPKPVV